MTLFSSMEWDLEGRKVNTEHLVDPKLAMSTILFMLSLLNDRIHCFFHPTLSSLKK